MKTWNQLRITKDRTFLVWGILFLLFYAFNLGLGVSTGHPETSLNFCFTVVLLLGFGLILEDELILSSVLVSTFMLNLPLTIDLIGHLFTGKILIGAGHYVKSLSPLRYAITFYHMFLLVIPVYVHLRTRKFHQRAWIFSSIHYLAVCLLSLAVTNPQENINFVRGPTALHAVYPIKPDLVPYWVFHWIFVTIIFFIPTHYTAAFLIKRQLLTKLFSQRSKVTSSQSNPTQHP